MNIFNDIFERSKENKELIGITRYADEESFWCGFVLEYNEFLVKIQHYTKYGKLDGLMIIQINEIKSLDFNDDYCKSMQVVIDYANELEKEIPVNLLLPETESWTSEILRQMEGDYEIITSVEINSDYFSGFVVDVSDTHFVLLCVGKIGEEEGTSTFKIEDISGFQINDIDNRKRVMLYKWRKASL
jgi:hypothetical protein